MKKPLVLTLSAAAAALVVAYGAATWWAGSRTEALYTAQVAQLQQRYPGLKLIDHQYQRGFWHSTSRVTLQYGSPEATDGSDTGDDLEGADADREGEEPEAVAPDDANANAAGDDDDAADDGDEAGEDASGDDADADDSTPPLYVTVVLQDRISHGPITSLHSLGAAHIDSTLLLDPRSTPELASALAGRSLARAQTDVDFSGDFRSQVEGLPLQWTSASGDAVQWRGFNGTLASAGQAQTLSYELSAPGLQLDNADQGLHVEVDGLSLRGVDKALNALWALSGRDEGQLASIRLKVDQTADDGQPFALVLQNVQFQQSNKMSGDLLDGLLQVTGSGSAGELPINSFELRTSLTRLHVPTYLRMAEQMAGLGNPGSVENTDAIVRGHLATLLAYNPEYALDTLNVVIDGQRGELSYRLGMPGVTPEEKDVPLSLLALSRLQLQARASLPTAWLEWLARESALDDGGNLTPAGAQVLLDELVRQRLVLRDGKDRVKTELRFAQGKLEVNGKPLRGGLDGLGALGNL